MTPFVKVSGEAMSMRDKMRLLDMDGNVICILCRKLMSFKETFKIKTPDEQNDILTIIRRPMTLSSIIIDVVDPINEEKIYFTSKTSGLGNQTVITNSYQQIIGKIGRGILQGDANNKYQIQITKGIDAAILICLCAAKDEMLEK